MSPEPSAREEADGSPAAAIDRLRVRVERLTWAVAAVAVGQVVLLVQAAVDWVSGWGSVFAVGAVVAVAVYVTVSGSSVAKATRHVCGQAAAAVRMLWRRKSREV
ncbi:MAG: hypothetical protein AAF532_11075 [Planctomycetota bacterium]